MTREIQEKHRFLMIYACGQIAIEQQKF